MRKKKAGKRPFDTEQVDERKAILDERRDLQKLFPSAYSPQIGVFKDGKVEVMFKLTRSQAESLAGLLKEHKL